MSAQTTAGKAKRKEENDEKERYEAAADAIIGADRMALGLACLPDKTRGDLDRVRELMAKLAAHTCGDCDPCIHGRPDKCALMFQ